MERAELNLTEDNFHLTHYYSELEFNQKGFDITKHQMTLWSWLNITCSDEELDTCVEVICVIFKTPCSDEMLDKLQTLSTTKQCLLYYQLVNLLETQQLLREVQ